MMTVFCGLGFELNEADWRDLTPLVAAILNGQFEIVRFLFEHGVDIRDRELLIEAVRSRESAIFRYLLDESGIDLHADGTGRTLLQEALNLGSGQVIDLLVDRGVSLDGLCLSLLVRRDRRKLFEHVLSRGGDINATMERTAPPIIFSIVQTGLVGANEFLSLGATLSGDIIASYPEGLESAIMVQDPSLLDFLLAYNPDLSRSRRLIGRLIDAWPGSWGTAALVTRIRALLEHGARGLHDPPPVPAPFGNFAEMYRTAVDIAIARGCTQILELFDEFGFDWGTVICVWKPTTPIQEEIYQFLMERGARFETQTIIKKAITIPTLLQS
jgi:hypothetical protein